MARQRTSGPAAVSTVLGTTSVVVMTEFVCESLTACVALWLRFVWSTKIILAAASGLTFSSTTTSWRDRRIVSISCWESAVSVYSLGYSRRHVEVVRWALRRGGIQTRSVLFESAGDWRDVMLRDRYRQKTVADPAVASQREK